MNMYHLMAHMPAHAQRAIAEEARDGDLNQLVSERMRSDEWGSAHEDSDCTVFSLNAD